MKKILFLLAMAIAVATHAQLLTTKSIFLNENKTPTAARNWAIRQNNSTDGDFQIGFTGSNLGGLPDFLATPADAKLTIKSTGSVCIGTIDPKGYKLAVAGKIVSEEVVVKLQANWPDYVFNSGYALLPLADLERFIKEHKHLPDAPSSTEVSENGISVGEMNAILLKKVEELTLYVIQLSKDNDVLRAEINALKANRSSN